MRLFDGIRTLKQLKSIAGDPKVWKRLVSYSKSLLEPKEGTPMDKTALKCLLNSSPKESSNKRELIETTVEYLKEMKFYQGAYYPEQIEEQIENFEKKNHEYFGHLDEYKQTVSEMKEEFSLLELQPLEYNSEQDLLDALPREQSHPGWTGLLHGLQTKKAVIKKFGFDTWIKETSQAIKKGSFNKFIVIGLRNQASLPFKDGVCTHEWKGKSRFISIVDTWVILAERMFSKPLQDWLSHQEWYAGGYDDEKIKNMMTSWAGNYSFSFTTDYSKFDQTISDWLIHSCFDIMEEAFPRMTEWQKAIFRVVRMDFIHKVILDGNLRCRESHKGVPSGSMFTSMVDSIVNRIMITTYLKSKGIKNVKFMVMGDDNIIFTGDELDKEDLANFLNKFFGVQVNARKIEFACHRLGQHPRFLSREWRPTGIYRDPKELIAKLLFPEKYRNYKRNKDLKPEYIIKGYIDSFGLGMAEIVDVYYFKRKFNLKRLEDLNKNERAALLPHMPGSVRVQYMYGTVA